ncbi:TVP38/TMEM64 family inner membrane protein YdjZ [Maioricimonas rarisocia]|uniref:TVP38/TMEM64 family inner membrane protein YdjZ n=1 Tax=Maioricimonas rarisocia TaxID=2528026 RepID=A0A517ZBW2_9PLAN|nr:VTT domain-containing protein [Maioricimonas rarisocia]QDU39929.1 TVP38/TMEM64 family inner membrane protein YdjZ [Maioricimonas rarisocia]
MSFTFWCGSERDCRPVHCQGEGTIKRLLRPLLLIAGALLIPVVPFLLLGESFEAQVAAWVRQEWSPATQFSLIVASLATDILLPIPSSAVSTYAGGVLGFATGTLASWLGMTMGACLGYGLARLAGRPLAKRFAGEKDLERVQELARRYGATAIVLTRPLPILAEACVLLMGVVRLRWPLFLVAIALSNLAVSATYAAFGQWFEASDSLPMALAISLVVPLVFTWLVRHRLRTDGLRGED